MRLASRSIIIETKEQKITVITCTWYAIVFDHEHVAAGRWCRGAVGGHVCSDAHAARWVVGAYVYHGREGLHGATVGLGGECSASARLRLCRN